MQELFIGEAIRRRREALGLTQEELCEGICEPVTLSRLENGKQSPSHNRVKALLQRLNLPDDRYYALTTTQEEAIRTVRKEARSCNGRFRRAEGDEKKQAWKLTMKQLKRLEELADKDDNITRQFILSFRATLGTEDGPYPLEKRLSMLTEALRLTVPDFDLKKVGTHRYSVDETELINQIAGTYSAAGEHEKALGIYRRLLDYIRKDTDQLPNYAPHLTLCTYNYARELALCEYYHEAIQAAEEGRRISIDYSYYQFLPGFLALLGECYYQVGEKEQSKKWYLQAHYIYEALGDQLNLKIIDPDIRDRFGIEFPIS